VNTKKILIVDDDPLLQESLASILESEGYYIDTARTGAEAKAKIRKEFFHVALLDVHLPDMRGTDLLVKINNIAPRMKKLVLTGYPDAASANKAVTQSADAILIKPFDPIDLINIIAEHIEIQEEEQGQVQVNSSLYPRNNNLESDSATLDQIG
jgi:DNA-binding NtrC family response regulator